MVIYSLLSDTVISIKKEKRKETKKKKKTHQSSIILLSLKMFSLPIACVISQKIKIKIKNQRSKSHGIKVLYIGHRFIYGTPQCLH